MARGQKLTEQQYDAIKLLLKGGATQTKAAEIMNVSSCTVNYVNRATSYSDYLGISRSIRAKQEAARVAPQTVTAQVPFYVTQEMKKTNELLTQISAKLAYIVEELCGIKKEG